MNNQVPAEGEAFKLDGGGVGETWKVNKYAVMKIWCCSGILPGVIIKCGADTSCNFLRSAAAGGQCAVTFNACCKGPARKRKNDPSSHKTQTQQADLTSNIVVSTTVLSNTVSAELLLTQCWIFQSMHATFLEFHKDFNQRQYTGSVWPSMFTDGTTH